MSTLPYPEQRMVRHVLGPLRPQLPILPHVHSSPRGDHGRDEIQGRNNYDRISILSSIRTGRSNAARHARRTGPQRRGAEGLVGLYCPSSQDRCRDARSIARHCAPRRRSPRSGSVCLDPNDPTSLVALMELAAKAHPREFPAWWTIVKRELLREGSDDPVPPDTYRKRQKRSVEAPAPSGDGHPTTGSERSGQGGRGGWGGRGGHGGQGGGGGKGGRGGGGGGGKGSRGGGADDRDAYNGDQNESPRDQYPRTGNETSERRPAGPGESNQRSVAADDRGGDDGAEMSSPQCEFRCYRMDMLTAQTCRATRMRTLRRQQLSPQTLQPLRSATSTTTERVSTPADGCIKFGA